MQGCVPSRVPGTTVRSVNQLIIDCPETRGGSVWVAVFETRAATGGASCIRIDRGAAEQDDEMYLSRFINGTRVQVGPDPNLDADLDFIARACEDMPRLVAEVRRLRKTPE